MLPLEYLRLYSACKFLVYTTVAYDSNVGAVNRSNVHWFWLCQKLGPVAAIKLPLDLIS